MNPVIPINVGSSPVHRTPFTGPGTTEIPTSDDARIMGPKDRPILSDAPMLSQDTTSAVANMTNMLNTIAEFLGASNTDQQTDRMLRLLVAAMFLLAVLEQMQGGKESEPTTGRLGQSQSDRSAYIGVFSSSTTIAMSETSISVSMETTSIVAETGSEPQMDLFA